MRSYTFRLSQEGVAELQKDLNSLGDSGAAAMLKLEQAAPGFGAALEAAANRAAAARKKLEDSAKREMADIHALLDGQVKKSEASFRSLQASLDPAYAAQQQFARGQDIVNDALKRNPALANDAARVNALLEKQLRSSTGAASGFATGLTGVTRVLGALGIAISAGSVVNYVDRIFEQTAALADQATQLQQTVESLQAYRLEFEESGSSAEAANRALAKTNELVGAATDNIGSARRELAEWNIDWRELIAAAPENRLALIAKGLLQIEDSGRRARAENALFGKSGQEVETVLEKLSGGIDQVIQKQGTLGKLIGNEAAKSLQEYKNRIAELDRQIQTESLPAAQFYGAMWLGIYQGINDVLGALGKIPGATGAALTAISAGGADFRRLPGQVVPDTSDRKPGNLQLHTVNSATDNKSLGLLTGPQTASNYSIYLAALREEAALTGLSAQKRAEVGALITAANERLKDGVVHQGKAADFAGKTALNYADALKILSPTEQAEVRRAAALKQAGDHADRIKITYAGILADMREEARVAGETAAKRESDLAVIEAAHVVQKQRGDKEKDLVRTYEAARKALGEIRTAEVEAAAAAKSRNQLNRDILQPLRDEVSLVGKTREEREKELEILRLKQQYGEAAVKMSEEELRNLMRKRDEMTGDDMIEDLREQVRLSGMSADEAEREHAVLQAIRATHGNLRDDQAQEIRQLIDMRREAEQMVGTAEEVRDVVEDWFEKGKVDLADLPRLFKRVAAQMAADALLSPIIMPIVGQFYGGGGAMGGLSQLLGGSSGMGMNPMMGMASMGGDVLGLGSSISGGMNWLGGALGFATPTSAAAIAASPGALSGAMGGISTSSIPAMQSGSLFGMTSLGSMLGGAGLGSLASSLVFGNKNDAGMGGMGGALAGAAIGSIIPGVGTIIGGLIGGLAGGGLGSMTGSSNQGAIANFGGDGTTNYLYKQGGGNNGQMATAAASQVSAVISALKAQGVTVSLGNVTGLSVGSDKSYVYDAAGGKQKLAGGDVEGVTTAILNRILPSASGGTADVQAVLSKYMQGGGINPGNLSQLSSDLGFANTLANLDFSVKQLTQSEQLLKQINDQYQGVIDKAKELGLSTSAIEDARANAIQGVVDTFNDTVGAAILQIQDPIAAASAALSEQQAQRIKEATALGADLSAVYSLNALETEQLIKAQTGQLDSTEALLSQAAAMAKQASDFNEDIRIKTLSFTDSLQAALDAEDVAGRERVAQARKIGADLAAVEEYNGLARKQIAESFAAESAAMAKQAADFNQDIRIKTLSFTDSLQAALDAEDVAGRERVALAKKIGADLAAVEEYNGLARQQIAESFAAESAAMARQASDFNEDIRIKTLSFTDSLQAALDAEDVAGRERVAQARKIGADLAAVEEFNGLVRKQIAEDFAAKTKQAADAAAAQMQQSADAAERTLRSAKANLASLVASLTYGNDSGASPDQKYFGALANYTNAKNAATSNPSDPLALATFQQAASTLAPIAREFLGTSKSYGSLTNEILATATSLGGDLADPSGYGRALIEATHNGSGAIVDALGLTNTQIADLRNDFRKLAAFMQAIVNRAA